MLPNIPPKLFSLSAVAVGYILIDDATANEQNAMGNWLMLAAQVLCTNAFYREVMQERGLVPDDSGKRRVRFSNDDSESTIIMLEKMIKALQQEVENIKNNSKN